MSLPGFNVEMMVKCSTIILSSTCTPIVEVQQSNQCCSIRDILFGLRLIFAIARDRGNLIIQPCFVTQICQIQSQRVRMRVLKWVIMISSSMYLVTLPNVLPCSSFPACSVSSRASRCCLQYILQSPVHLHSCCFCVNFCRWEECFCYCTRQVWFKKIVQNLNVDRR